MTRRPFRVIVAAALAAAALLTLAGCRVQPGAAAFVGDHRVSESDVESYVSTTAPSTATQAGQLPPRAQALSTLVITEVLGEYLSVTGGIPSRSELDASRDAAFTLVTGQSLPDIATLTDAIVKLGFKARFVDAYILQVEREYVVINRSKAASLAALGTAVSAKTPKVRVSPRYGTWDASQLSLSGATTTPSYLKLSTASTTAT